MKKARFLAIILILLLFALWSCGEKGKEKEQRASNVEMVEGFPSQTDEAVEKTQKAQGEDQQIAGKDQAQSRQEDAVVKREKQTYAPETSTFRKETKVKRTPRYPVTIRVDIPKITGIETTYKIIHVGRDIYEGSQSEITLKIDSTNFDKEAQLIAPFYYPIKFLFKKDEKINLRLQPILARVKFYDKSGLYSQKLNKIIVKIEGKKVGETDQQGLAQIYLKNEGSNQLECYKAGVIKRQYVALNFTNPDSLYEIGLDPFEHFVQLKLMDDNGKPLSQKSVVLYGGRGITLKGVTQRNGFIKFSSVKLAPGIYTIQIPDYSFKNDRLEITADALDNERRYLSLKIPLKIDWYIEADIRLASLKLYSADDKLITEGTGSLKVKLPKGVYKVVADYKDAHREVIFSATDTPHRLSIIVMHPYLSALKWQKDNPEKKIPSNYIQAMQNISPGDEYFVDSRLFLAKIFIDYFKKYDLAVRMYNDIFEADRSSQYKSDILFQMAQAMMLSTDKMKNTKREKELRLQQALNEYCDKAWAYLSYLPQKSRKMWGMKITALRGELNYRLSTYKEENNDTRAARRYAEAAKDYFKQFKMDYENLAASNKLKQELKNDYYRVSDLLSMLESKIF
ncbi:hypothetical protein [Caldithrix abyssi]